VLLETGRAPRALGLLDDLQRVDLDPGTGSAAGGR
jgi:hypothetical protein